MTKSEIYISTDVETDGPIPGPYSLLSFASVAFDASGVALEGDWGIGAAGHIGW